MAFNWDLERTGEQEDVQPTTSTGPGTRSPFRKNPFRIFGRAVKGLLRTARRRPRMHRHRPSAFASLSAAMSECYDDEQYTSTSPRVLSEFPMVIEGPSTHSQGQKCQRLVTIGSRHWGTSSWWDTRSYLKIKIYDFAVYADTEAVHSAALARQSCQSQFFRLGQLQRSRSMPSGQEDVLAQLVQSSRPGALDASIMLHAARNLPVDQLAQELHSVLLRRNIKAGGTTDDPALKQLIGFLSSEVIPAGFLTAEKDQVKRGGIIAFHRTCGGSTQLQGSGTSADAAGIEEPNACKIVALAGDHVLGSVTSRSLGTALFDLYVGDEPVSNRAKAAAIQSLTKMAQDPGAMYAPRIEDTVRCLGSNPDSCAIQLQ